MADPDPAKLQVNVADLADAVRRNDLSKVRAVLRQQPQLVHMDMAGDNEHRALHYAVLNRLPDMVRVLMEAGADARKGIYPHREATSALTMAQERGYDDIVAIIEPEEQHRREALSCPNATVSPWRDMHADRAHDPRCTMRDDAIDPSDPILVLGRVGLAQPLPHGAAQADVIDGNRVFAQ